MLDPAFGKRPQLVQRTSSVDTRKDMSQHTWMSLLTLLKPREYFVTVDHFSIWRRHLSWAKENGTELRSYMTQKFSTNMVFMSLLLGAELNILFNSSQITTKMRHDMHDMNHTSIEFWIGITIIFSVVMTLFTLLATFTAWGMVSSVSDCNAHCVLRSSIGQYVTFLPAKLIVAAIYSFLLWMVMFIYLLLPHRWSAVLLVLICALFFHIVSVFSAFGRLIMHTGAMSNSPIFDSQFEEELLPRGLHTSLLFKAVDELRKGTSVTRQYRNPARPIGRVESVEPKSEESTVRFADTLYSSIRSDQTESFSSARLSSSKRCDSTSSLTGAANALSPTSMEKWISHDQSTVNLPAPSSEKKVPRQPSNNLSRPRGVRRSFHSDGSIDSNNAVAAGRESAPPKAGTSQRRSLTEILPRPQVLNASAHTAKSIRRLITAKDEENFDPQIEGGQGGQGKDGSSSQSVVPSLRRNESNEHYGSSPPREMRSEPSSDGEDDNSDTAELVETLAGLSSERQYLLADVGQKATYLSESTTGRIEGSIPSQPNTENFSLLQETTPWECRAPPPIPSSIRKRTETTELIEIVSSCMSDSLGKVEGSDVFDPNDAV